jgi:hypothetical protein
MPQNNIVFLDSTRQGAPVITGQVNTLNAALYQLLCTGCNSQTATGVTRNGAIVTVTKAGHGFRTYDWILRAGADPSDYNGMFQVTGYTADTLTHAIATTPGAIVTPGTVAFAPLGWTRDYNGTNKSEYYGDNQSSGLRFYIDDSGVLGSNSYRGAWVRGYESWTVDIGVNPWPTVTQLTNGLYWNKSSTLDGTARAWWIRGSGKRFLLGILWSASYSDRADVFGFGDYLGRIPGFAYPGFIIGSPSDDYSSPPGTNNLFATLTNLGTTQAGHYLCRKYDASGGAIAFGKMGNNAISTTIGIGTYSLPGANPATSGYELTPIDIHAGSPASNASFYSPLPGAFHLLHDQLFNTYELVPTPAELFGRRLMVFKVGAGYAGGGRLVLDLTGPDE